MSIADVIFASATILWIAEFIIFKNRHSQNDKNQNKTSFPWILFSIMFVILSSILSREYAVLHRDVAILSWIGVVVYSCGIFLRYWGMHKLGIQFTRNVTVQQGDRIISTGPFSLLRHPLYTGLFLTMIGVSLYTGSLLGLIFTFLLFLPILINRISLEETMLLKAFGQEYEQWCKRRYRLLPYIY
ncbi:methyltransferase family protein [Salipaludibacillus sp. CF4.18]|uniref:methyltransferase family protein n=1 Tax=Salipaludibacillus sp. CF4.18 TaxID=3373081 RepID=UPI003EE80258